MHFASPSSVISGNETSKNVELGLNELDTVAGGAGCGCPVEKKGVITQKLSDTRFQVQLGNGTHITCSLSWKLKGEKALLPGKPSPCENGIGWSLSRRGHRALLAASAT
jgi:hypothetical protein